MVEILVKSFFIFLLLFAHKPSIGQLEIQCIDYTIEVFARSSQRSLQDSFFCEGEKVVLCAEIIYDASWSNIAWLQGVIPNFGEGWDMVAFNPQPITHNDHIAEWMNANDTLGCIPQAQIDLPFMRTFKDSDGILRFEHLTCQTPESVDTSFVQAQDTLPSGWFFKTPSGTATCNGNGCNSTSFWGLPNSNSITNLTFCFEIDVLEDISGCDTLDHSDLSIDFFITSDAITGCWDSQVENVNKDLYIGPNWKVDCDVDTSYISIDGDQVVCSGEELNLNILYEGGNALIWVVDNPFVSGDGDNIGSFENPTEFTSSITINEVLINNSDVVQTVEYHISKSQSSYLCGRTEVIYITIYPEPDYSSDILNYDPSLSICEEEQVAVWIDKNLGDFIWKKGSQVLGTDNIITLSEAGSYTVVIINDNNCTTSLQFNIDNISVPPVTGIFGPISSEPGSIDTFKILNNDDEVDYIWTVHGGDIIDSSVDSVIVGWYAQVDDYTGSICASQVIYLSDDRVCQGEEYCLHVEIMTTETIDILNDKLDMFPNPTSGFIYLSYSDINIESIMIYSASGKLNKLISGDRISEVNIANLTAGVYFIKVIADVGTLYKKIIKL